MNKTRRDGDTQFTEYVHKQRARNVFMRCQRRQRGVGWGWVGTWGKKKELQRRVSSKSQTLIQQIHLVLSLKRAAKATKPHSLPNEGVLMPEHSFPSGC